MSEAYTTPIKSLGSGSIQIFTEEITSHSGKKAITITGTDAALRISSVFSFFIIIIPKNVLSGQ